MSPTQRTLKFLRRQGWIAEVVERFVGPARIRKDLFGIIDIVAVRSGEILGVQTTSGSNVSARVDKAKKCEHLKTWLAAGGLFEIHGWRLKGPRGKRKTWQVRVLKFNQVEEVTENDNTTGSV